MKKTLAIILTVAFVLSLGSVAFAEPYSFYSPQGTPGTYSSPASDTIVNKFNQTIDGWTAFYVTGHAMVEVTPTLYDERGWYSGSYEADDNQFKSLLWADVTVYDNRPTGSGTETYYGDVKVYNDIGRSNEADPQGNMVGYAFFQTAELGAGGQDPGSADTFDNQRVTIELEALFGGEDEAVENVTVTNSLTVDHAITADASLDYKQLPSWHELRQDDEMDNIYDWFETNFNYATTTIMD